jgi:hypothetical protein
VFISFVEFSFNQKIIAQKYKNIMKVPGEAFPTLSEMPMPGAVREPSLQAVENFLGSFFRLGTSRERRDALRFPALRLYIFMSDHVVGETELNKEPFKPSRRTAAARPL